MDPIPSPNQKQGSDSVWPRALSVISRHVNDHVMQTYFERIRCLSESKDQVRLALPNKFMRDWVVDHYQSFLQEAVSEVTQSPTEVEITVDVSTLRAPQQAQAALRKEAPPNTSPASSSTRFSLNDKYTFENFVCGSSNQFAHAACKSVAESPGLNYNPLFIFGGTGLGKTHLLHSIGIELRRRHPEWNILLLSAEAFTNEVIASIREFGMDSLRRSFRQQCDVLLMDDIQFLAGKDRTQEEFFHTFNSLHDTRRQIVVTSDKYPNEIAGLEERLASRFQWGLVADVQPPDLETRVAILEKKASFEGIELPEDVSMFLATHVKRNVRELEGALVRVEAFASLNGEQISINLARQALQDQLIPEGRPPDVDKILRTVAEHFSVKVGEICSDRRHKAIVLPRQVAMYLVRDLTGLSYPDIGRRLGGKDHSTIMSACRKISSLMETDTGVRKTIDHIGRALV